MRNPWRPRVDDSSVKRHRRLDDRRTDALLRGRRVEGEPALSDLVTELRALGESAAPAPSEALAAMLADGVRREDRVVVAPGEQPVVPEVSAADRRPVRAGWALTGMAAAAVAVVGTAQANALPTPAQDAVATAVGWITPLELPRSDDDGQDEQRDDAPSPADTKTTPTTRPSPAAVPAAPPSSAPRLDDEPVVDPSDDASAEPDEEWDEPTEDPTEEDPVEEPTDEPTEEPTQEPDDAGPLGLGGIVPDL